MKERSNLLPALKGGGYPWAGRRPRPVFIGVLGGGHGSGPGQHRGPFAAGLQRHERSLNGVSDWPWNNGIRLPHSPPRSKKFLAGGGLRGGVAGVLGRWGRRAGENIDVSIFVVKLINSISGQPCRC